MIERGEQLCETNQACLNLEGGYDCVCSPGLYPVFLDHNTTVCGSELTPSHSPLSLFRCLSLIHTLPHSFCLSVCLSTCPSVYISLSITHTDLIVNEGFEEHSVIATFSAITEDQVQIRKPTHPHSPTPTHTKSPPPLSLSVPLSY